MKPSEAIKHIFDIICENRTLAIFPVEHEALELSIEALRQMQEREHSHIDSLCKIRGLASVDAVEVVRCKDCKHNGTWQCHMEYDEYHPEADIHHEMHGDDDFCSYGEKEAT